jgi:hypothetical protein
MEKEIKKEEGIVTKFGIFKRRAKSVPERVLTNRKKYLQTKSKK